MYYKCCDNVALLRDNIKQNHANSSDDLNMTDHDHFEKNLAHGIHVDLTEGRKRFPVDY